MILNNYRNLYYRGSLKSCNYTCSYCPFSKNNISQEELSQDRYNLNRFIEILNKKNTESNIFFTPYGEGLIHKYYIDSLYNISKNRLIKKIGIQTNGSFDMDYFLDVFSENKYKEKILLWITYHPAQIELSKFIDRVKTLDKSNIELSIGIVGDFRYKNEIIRLREAIGNHIYLWINKIEGTKIKYSENEGAFFTTIDPFFVLENEEISSNIYLCNGGDKNIFIDSNGKIYPCNINRQSIGKIDGTLVKSPKCKMKNCSCFLAYSNRKDIDILRKFGNTRIFRTNIRCNRKAFFFDIDGVIVNKNNTLDKKIIEKIKKISKNNLIFLNTALPFEIAYRKCKRLWKFINGGVFGNGSDIRLFDYNYNYRFYIDKSIEKKLKEENFKCYELRYNNRLCKLTVLRNKDTMKKLEQYEGYIRISAEKNKAYITNQLASKLNGIKMISRFYLIDYNNIRFFGNSENDKEAMDFLKKYDEIH